MLQSNWIILISYEKYKNIKGVGMCKEEKNENSLEVK